LWIPGNKRKPLRKAWIRVDANTRIGRGHLSRCMALAEMLKADFAIVFLIAAANKSFCQPLLADWEVCYMEEEAILLALLHKEDLLLVDSYDIDNDWRIKHKPLVHTLVDVNDIPGQISGAHVILNHCPALQPDRYTTDENTLLLLGMDYAILRPDFLSYAQNAPVQISGTGVFICFGGADPHLLGHKAAQELLIAGFKDPVYLVSAAESELTAQLMGYENFHLLSHLNAAAMRTHMLKARVLLLSASILSFEAVALRKPLLALYYVDNQELIYEGLVKLGMAKGYGKVASAEDMIGIYQDFESLYSDDATLQKMVIQQQLMLDGQSKDRVRDCLVRKLIH